MTNNSESQSVKPFARQGWQISTDAYVYDEIMPIVSGSEWKILSFIIRKTVGWNKETDELSISQIQKGTGIKSQTTVINGCAKLADREMIIKIPGNRGRNEHGTFGLNFEYELIPKNRQKDPKNPTPKNGSGNKPTPKIGSRQLQKLESQDNNNNKQDSKTTCNTNVLLSPKGLSVKQFDIIVQVLKGTLADLQDHLRGNSKKGIKAQGHLYTDEQLDALIAMEPDIRVGLSRPKRSGAENLLRHQKEFNKFSLAYKYFANAGQLGLTNENMGFNGKDVREAIEAACGTDSAKIQLLFDIHKKGREEGYWNGQQSTYALAWLKVGKLPTGRFVEYTNGYRKKGGDKPPLKTSRDIRSFDFQETTLEKQEQ